MPVTSFTTEAGAGRDRDGSSRTRRRALGHLDVHHEPDDDDDDHGRPQPQAMTAPEGPRRGAPGLVLAGGRAPGPPGRRPVHAAAPPFPPAALAVTGRLCWRLRSLAETAGLGVFPPGFGLLPPTGARLLSAIVPASPCASPVPVSVSGRTGCLQSGPPCGGRESGRTLPAMLDPLGAPLPAEPRPEAPPLPGPGAVLWSTVTVDGRSVTYGVTGAGRTALFLHGWGLRPHAYRAAIRHLGLVGCRVVAPVMPGFGGSRGLPRPPLLRGVRRLGGPVPRRRRGRPGRPGRRPLLRRRRGHRVRPRRARSGPARCTWPTPSAARPGRSHADRVRTMAQRPVWDWGRHLSTDLVRSSGAPPGAPLRAR